MESIRNAPLKVYRKILFHRIEIISRELNKFNEGRGDLKKIFINGFRDDLTQEAEIFFIFIRIDIFIFLEMERDAFIENGFFGSSSFIDFAAHHSRDGQ